MFLKLFEMFSKRFGRFLPKHIFNIFVILNATKPNDSESDEMWKIRNPKRGDSGTEILNQRIELEFTFSKCVNGSISFPVVFAARIAQNSFPLDSESEHSGHDLLAPDPWRSLPTGTVISTPPNRMVS